MARVINYDPHQTRDKAGQWSKMGGGGGGAPSEASMSAALNSGKGLATYINDSGGAGKFTGLQLRKIAALNPNGVSDKVIKVPKATSDKGIEHLKANLPPGTVIKKVNASPKAIGQVSTKQQKSSPKTPVSTPGQTVTTTTTSAGSPKKSAEQSSKLASLSDGTGVQSGNVMELGGTAKVSKEASKQWKNGLSKQESSAVSDWTDGEYKGMRKTIAKGDLVEGSKASNFMKAIDKAPDYKGTGYRGIKTQSDNNEKDYGNKQIAAISAAGIGGTWSDPSPHSISISSSVGLNFSGADVPAKYGGKPSGLILKIKSKSAADIRAKSILGEGEVIGKPNTQYRITKIVKNAKLKAGQSTRLASMYVELEEI